MKDRLWLRNTINYKIIDYHQNNGQVYIGTDKGILVVDTNQLDHYLKSWLPVENPEENTDIILFEKEKLNPLYDTIFDNIDRLKNEPGFIKQADAINRSIKTLIDSVKLGLLIKKKVEL